VLASAKFTPRGAYVLAEAPNGKPDVIFIATGSEVQLALGARADSGVVREGWFHGVCFTVHKSVFQKIGFLDTDRLLFGREDAEFLARCQRGGIPVGTVGSALMHHFGSITQKAMKQEQGVSKFGDHRYFYSKVGLDWWGRQKAKFARKAQTRRWIEDERERTGMTLHMVHREHAVEYR